MSNPHDMARLRDISIDRETILRAAFGLLDETGLDGITMRALAARLSVQAPALYWHVKDKAELIAMMAQDLYLRGREECRGSADARSWLLALGQGLRRVLTGHRDAGRLLAIARPLTHADAALAERMAAPLGVFGFSVARALEAQAAVLSLTLGWALYRENAAMAEHLLRMFDLDASYEKGLPLLVDGLVA
ncbi:TetR family transcriptional regulator [Sphingomonas sp.]|uniref:TetR family transcriptional regulator n=2 Tax=unclassified Sphingomonas TaxID=196159 RepID=UPI00257D9E61|nr:TetR family transcriptional regulator [Sphingomonas sp.]